MPARSRPAFALRLLLAVVVAVSWLAVPAQAAEPLSTDAVGGVRVADDPSLGASAPGVTMPSGVLWTTDGRPLWERDPGAVRAMASTTKIMTALVALKYGDLDEEVVVSERAARVGEAGVALAAGQRIPLRTLVEAVLVRSGNDAAFALAEHVAGSVEAFVDLMNEEAASLGLEDTHYANPHGLDEQGHHTSARDLAALSAVAMADERFAAIVTMPTVTVTGRSGPKTYENSNKLLGSYDGATGVKTGWTNRAGYCVVASAERDDIGLIAVVLGGTSEDDRFVQARELLDWGFEHYVMTEVSSAEETAAVVPVSDYLDRTVAAVVSGTVAVPVFDYDGVVTSRVDVVQQVEAPVEAGQRMGTLVVTQGERLLAQVPIVAAESVPEPEPLEAIGIWFTRLWRTVFGGELVAAPVPVM